MKKFLTAVAAAAAFVASPVLAHHDPIGPEHDNTKHAQGCMMLMECEDGLVKLESVDDLRRLYPDQDWSVIATEVNEMLAHLTKLGIPVHVGDQKYFMLNEMALYDTAYNRVWISDRVAQKPWSFMNSFRHEAWHTAQDCMAGGINNTYMAVIYGSEGTPAMWTAMAERLYPPQILEWEAEAKWAGAEVGMTNEALAACTSTNQKPWRVMSPTPMTMEWLESKGYTN